MPIELGGKPCLEPNAERDSCARAGLPAPWYGKPNAYENSLGWQSGTGWALLLRRDLANLSLEREHDFVFAGESATRGGRPVPEAQATVTHRNLHVVRADCILPGHDADPAAPYLVELADRRRLALQRPVNRNYNVRAQDGSYYATALDGGAAWSWDGLVGDLWAMSGIDLLGRYPGLGLAPDGVPESWVFSGGPSAIEAMGLVLARLGLALAYESQAGTFTIARLARTADVPARLRQDLIFDAAPFEPEQGRVAATVRVLFPALHAAPFGDVKAHYAIDVPAGPGQAGGARAGSVEQLLDDLHASYDGPGGLTNLAALTARATERAADYYALAARGSSYRAWSLPQPLLRPGPAADGVRWSDRGGGLITETWRRPARPGRPTMRPCPCPEEGGGGGCPITFVSCVQLVWPAGSGSGSGSAAGSLSGSTVSERPQLLVKYQTWDVDHCELLEEWCVLDPECECPEAGSASASASASGSASGSDITSSSTGSSAASGLFPGSSGSASASGSGSSSAGSSTSGSGPASGSAVGSLSGSAGSGSLSGPAGGTLSCCPARPGALSATLLFSLATSDPDCACLDGVSGTMTYNHGALAWTGLFSACGKADCGIRFNTACVAELFAMPLIIGASSGVVTPTRCAYPFVGAVTIVLACGPVLITIMEP